MSYFLRYTNNAEADLNRNCSYHYSDFKVGSVNDMYDDYESSEEALLSNVWECEIENVVVIGKYYTMKLNGLCGFELNCNSLESAILEAEKFYFNEVYNTNTMQMFTIFEGDYISDNVEGCLFNAKSIVYRRKKCKEDKMENNIITKNVIITQYNNPKYLNRSGLIVKRNDIVKFHMGKKTTEEAYDVLLTGTKITLQCKIENLTLVEEVSKDIEKMVTDLCLNMSGYRWNKKIYSGNRIYVDNVCYNLTNTQAAELNMACEIDF